MSEWSFEDAATHMATATEVLAVRDEIADVVAPLGLEVPEDLEAAYESSAEGLDEVEALTDETLDAAERLAEAETAVAADRNPLERVGLLFSDVSDEVDAAEAAFAAGEPADVVEHADAARDLVDDAASAGVTRLAIVLGAGLVLTLAVILLARRGRRRP
jgi:hypothetical protein